MDRITKRTWAGLVNYVNRTATADEIRATIADCMGWVAATLESDVFDRIFMARDPADLSKEAELYRPHVETLLRFLCSAPKSEVRDSLRTEAFGFLLEHADHIRALVFKEVRYEEEYFRKLNYSPDELENIKQKTRRIFEQGRYMVDRRGQATLAGEDVLPLGQWIPSRSYIDVADSICDFLCSEYAKYLNREVSRKDKKAAPLTPIFVCPSCKKLVMPKRIGRRQYCSECSDRARTEKYRQRASPDEGRDYAWLNRLRNLESDTRKIRLRQPKVKQRLTEIKSRQKNSHRCQGLLQVLHL
jgi:hypothetical protein